jgi:hypothetical protein
MSTGNTRYHGQVSAGSAAVTLTRLAMNRLPWIAARVFWRSAVVMLEAPNGKLREAE